MHTGLVDTAVKTAETGYMQRRLVKVSSPNVELSYTPVCIPFSLLKIYVVNMIILSVIVRDLLSNLFMGAMG